MTPLALLLDLAKRLQGRGQHTEMDGLSLSAVVAGRRVLVAHALSDGRVRIVTPLVWTGHEHAAAEGLGDLKVTPGSRAADPIRLAAAIRERLAARERELARCLHAPSADGVCPECWRELPAAPAGTQAALECAVAEMRRGGVYGSLRVQAVGASLRVVWVAGSGSRTHVTRAALACAVAHLRAAGLSADVVPGLDYALLDALPAAELRTVLDGGEVEPRSETVTECAAQAA